MLIEPKVANIERISVFECLDLMSVKPEVRFIMGCTYRVFQIIDDIWVIV